MCRNNALIGTFSDIIPSYGIVHVSHLYYHHCIYAFCPHISPYHTMLYHILPCCTMLFPSYPIMDPNINIIFLHQSTSNHIPITLALSFWLIGLHLMPEKQSPSCCVCFVFLIGGKVSIPKNGRFMTLAFHVVIILYRIDFPTKTCIYRCFPHIFPIFGSKQRSLAL